MTFSLYQGGEVMSSQITHIQSQLRKSALNVCCINNNMEH